MKYMKATLKLILKFAIIAIAFCLCPTHALGQDLRLTYVNGVQYSYKPSLTQRMSGVKQIYLFYPNSSTQTTDMYAKISRYIFNDWALK